jgi:hypothetical protein
VEHLKAIFHEELADSAEGLVRVEGGLVHIYEGRWEPHDLLKAMGTAAYEKEFRSWLANYREQRLERGQELLEQFDQRERFDALKSAYSRRFVIPFVGAGMSQPSGYPGWTAFLYKLWAKLEKEEAELDEILGRGEFEEAAQLLGDLLGPALFNEQVKNTYGIEKTLSGPIQLCPYLFRGPVVTTNFDDVLKRGYEAAQIAFSETLLGAQALDFTSVLATGKPFLTKLHGTATSVANRVLTKEEYERAYADPKTLKRIVNALCTTTLLFLGCGLSVDRLLTLFRNRVVEEGHDGGGLHYAFLRAPATGVERRKREAFLIEHNIYPIWYADADDSAEIEALLHLLADRVVSW